MDGVYIMETPIFKWMILGGTTIFGNIQISVIDSVVGEDVGKWLVLIKCC